MPWILAFDTSTEFCSVALGDGTRTLFRHEHTGARSSSPDPTSRYSGCSSAAPQWPYSLCS
ncbi:hypothetical protein ACQCR9_26570, partial [Ralstonia pseudosolanacearum]